MYVNDFIRITMKQNNLSEAEDVRDLKHAIEMLNRVKRPSAQLLDVLTALEDGELEVAKDLLSRISKNQLFWREPGELLAVDDWLKKGGAQHSSSSRSPSPASLTIDQKDVEIFFNEVSMYLERRLNFKITSSGS